MPPDFEKDLEGEGDLNDDESLDGLEDDNDLFHKREESYEERLKAANRDIKRRRVFTDEDVEGFLAQYADITDKSVEKQGDNLLHTIVTIVKHNEDIRPKALEPLVRRLVEQWPSRIKEQNKDQYNPIYLAIRESQHELVNYMTLACPEPKYLDEALRTQVPDGSTCLHAAIKLKLHAPTTRILFEKASDEALADQDGAGKTPMHHAVSFAQCSDERMELIALLIKRDLKLTESKPPPQKTFLDVLDTRGRSVYREHENTRALREKVRGERRQAEAPVNKPNQPDAAKSGAPAASSRTATKEPRTQTNARDMPPPPILTGDRGAERNRPDEREELRRRKKLEEAARRKEDELKKLSPEETRDGTSSRQARTGERDFSNREAGRTLVPLRTNAAQADDSSVQLEVRPANTLRQHEPVPITPNTPNMQVKRRGTMRFDGDMKPSDAARPPAAARGSAWDNRIRNSDVFRHKLKLHYLRTRGAEMAIQFLYGTNMDDVLISFDYDRLPARINWGHFEKRFGVRPDVNLRFDAALQYVTFPRVEVYVTGRQADQERDEEAKTGNRPVGTLGRRDMCYFFGWLYKKGVRHIIKVSVEDSLDSGETVHSDEAIQQSLERFVVEELDWTKKDLDPDIILRVSSKLEKAGAAGQITDTAKLAADSQLRVLYLRWSGSNAVLRAWSSPDGLALLPNLQRIVLFKPPADKTYDNAPWIKAKIEEFKTRLNASRQSIRAQQQLSSTLPVTQTGGDGSNFFGPVEVTSAETVSDQERKAMARGSAHLNVSGPAEGVNEHKWLISTSRFAGEMIPFWKTTRENFLESRQNLGTQEGIENDVVLALIDDGVDMFDDSLTSQILEGKSFDFHGGKVRPPFSSAKGHGTIMASMILRVCPMVKVYPIRLRTHATLEGKNMNIDARYAAQAIQAALDKNATIISMSWTIPMKDDSSGAKKELHKVLEKAKDRGVLVFCSAPDQGKFTGQHDYPSGPFRDNFFCIGAAGADGRPFDWTPDDGITYVLPGVDVIKQQVTNNSRKADSTGRAVHNIQFETGSSVATALAAGLAAMIIYIVKATILQVKTANHNKGTLLGIGIPDDGAEQIAQHPEEMKRAFRSLGSVTQNNFIQVWEELDRMSETLEALQTAPEDMQKKYREDFVAAGCKIWNAAKHGVVYGTKV